MKNNCHHLSNLLEKMPNISQLFFLLFKVSFVSFMLLSAEYSAVVVSPETWKRVSILA